MTFQHARGRSRGALALRVTGALGLAAASGGAWLALEVGTAPEISAAVVLTNDLDSDGLPDALEKVIGTHAIRADSDGDGFDDVEELARGSHPMRSGSIPTSTGISVSMDAYRAGPRVHVVTAVYLPDGVVAGKSIRFVTAAGDKLLQVPLQWLDGGHKTKSRPASGGGRVIVLDPVLTTELVLARSGFTLCAVVSDGGEPVAADVADLRVVSGQIYEQIARPVASKQEYVQPQQSGPGSPFGGLGVGGMYRPLMVEQGDPSPGEICVQTTVTVGVINGVVIQEVAAADCVAGWDAYCAPGCAGMVGTQIKTIDPAALIGN